MKYVALLSGIVLSPELLGRYGRRTKNRDPVSVLRSRTSWSLASLPSSPSDALYPLTQYWYTLLAGTLLPPADTLAALSTLLAPLLLSESPRWVAPLAFFTRYATYSTVATCVGYRIPGYCTISLDVPKV